jgi:hypothetical protein
MPPRDLEERRSGAGWRGKELDGHQQLVRLERGGQDAGEELGRRDGASAPPASSDEPGIERQHHRRQLGRRIGMRQAPTDRPAVPDLRVGNPRQRLGEQRRAGSHGTAPLDCTLARHRPDPKPALSGLFNEVQ